jgi:hypothetical protein
MVVVFAGPGVIRRYRIGGPPVLKGIDYGPLSRYPDAHAKAPAAAAALSHRANQHGRLAAGAYLVISRAMSAARPVSWVRCYLRW